MRTVVFWSLFYIEFSDSAHTPYCGCVSSYSLTNFVGPSCGFLPTWKNPLPSSLSFKHQDISWHLIFALLSFVWSFIASPSPSVGECLLVSASVGIFSWLLQCSCNFPSAPTQTVTLQPYTPGSIPMDPFVCARFPAHYHNGHYNYNWLLNV